MAIYYVFVLYAYVISPTYSYRLHGGKRTVINKYSSIKTAILNLKVGQKEKNTYAFGSNG